MLQPSVHSPSLWYRDKKTFRLGDICRYRVTFTNRDETRTEIYLRVKNVEKTGLRAFHLVNGPFILYCHVIPANYDPHCRFEPENPSETNEVCFRNSIKPGQTFNVRLCLNRNSLIRRNSDGSTTYQWTCDLMCQIVLNTHASLSFVVMVGEDLAEMRRVSRSALTALTKGDFSVSLRDDYSHTNATDWGSVTHEGLSVECFETDDIWKKSPRLPGKPIHLVIITHGIFSNLTADMLYVRDMLSSLQSDNFLIDGYRGNAGHTEKGIHKQGVGVSTFVTDLIASLQSQGHTVSRLSFVGHSFGGPVQLYAVKHIILTHGTDYFERQHIELKNFVCLASPMLGVVSEVSLWISWFLDLGTLGKTGRDLTLSKKFPNVKRHGETKFGMVRPILETLPDDPVQSVLKSFTSRVVYANAVNDGIVPLRTSALLYLDWQALGDVRDLKNNSKKMGDEENDTDSKNSEEVSNVQPKKNKNNTQKPSTEENKSGNDVGQIPEDSEINISEKYTSFLARIFNMDSEPTMHTKEQRPKRIKRKFKRYARINAKSSDRNEISKGKKKKEEDDDEINSLNIPPKASAVESAINSLICPIPSREYIDDPDSRTPVIFHDKYYHFSNIPDQENRPESVCDFLRYYDWRMNKQVKIARKYHAPELSWRKVLVYLPPDAHNNIIVRRRFANGYGWGVIEHLRQEVFGGEKVASKF
ncbi:hypothetical protein JCM33374_g4291 [Metschnikowia sp. JCM 33374]|nr:hypothetical protein JCM33374_g4291 [Metschnikowia sp. JCM 33374]